MFSSYRHLDLDVLFVCSKEKLWMEIVQEDKRWCQKIKHVSDAVLILFSVGDTVFAESENIQTKF